MSNTETPAMQFFHNQHYPQFDVTVFSCAEGTRKPEPQIYQLLLRRLQLPPEDALFIDDNPGFIQAASHLNINTILYENQKQLRNALFLLHIRTTPL